MMDSQSAPWLRQQSAVAPMRQAARGMRLGSQSACSLHPAADNCRSHCACMCAAAIAFRRAAHQTHDTSSREKEGPPPPLLPDWACSPGASDELGPNVHPHCPT